MSCGVMCTPPSPSLMSPPEIVLATSVAIGVAIALAVSWNPLVK